MSHRLLACLAVSLGISLAACTDRQQVPSGPQFASTLPVSNTCDFNALNSLISSVFNPPQSQTVQNLKQAMENAGAQSATARERGFDIMVEIGKASRSGSPPDPSDGRNLTVGLIRCMFDATNATEFPNFPDPTVYNFAAALNWSAGGGYWVRGGAADPETAPALARSGTSIASGVAPPAPPTTPVAYKWRNTAIPPAARNGILDERVLIYGYPVTGGYDWSQIRPLAIENPFSVVALCNVEATLFTMIQESNVGALPYDEATAASLCAATPSLTLLEQEHGPLALVSRLAQFGADLLGPAPLHATTLLLTTSVGGLRSTRSRFTKLEVESVTSKWLQAPPPSVKVNTPFTVKIEATTKDGNKTIPALGVCYTVIGGANNGTPGTAQLTGAHNCGQGTAPSSVTTLVDGKAIATLVVTATQTGNLITTASGVVLQRGGAVGSLTARTKVIP